MIMMIIIIIGVVTENMYSVACNIAIIPRLALPHDHLSKGPALSPTS
jgi:hypothetical protein